jgi:hypothetical protein
MPERQQSFLTASALGISEAQRNALLKVLKLLEREELHHVGGSAINYPATGFNMNLWPDSSLDTPRGCGTARCIAGWAEHIGRIRFAPVGRPVGLNRLFDPDEDGGNYDYNSITPAQAAASLRNYLLTGEPRWAEVLMPPNPILGQVNDGRRDCASRKAVHELFIRARQVNIAATTADKTRFDRSCEEV